MSDPLTEPAKGTPYWLRPERDLAVEARHLKFMRELAELKKLKEKP